MRSGNEKLRLAVALWLTGMVGVALLSLTVLPQLLANAPLPVPIWIAVAGSVLQSSVLVALAIWAGVALSPQLGLGAPVFEAALAGAGAWAALRVQLIPASVVGLLAGGMLVLLGHVAPPEILAVTQPYEIPLAAKILYGGVTEEILLRWGVLTVLIWLPWRFVQKRHGLPRTVYVVGAITVAALLFGVGHLPAAAAMGVALTFPVVTFIIVGNTVGGLLFGFLYWRKGLESAMVSHALAHAVAVMVSVL